MKILHKILIVTGLATCVLGIGFAVSYGIYQDKVPQVAKAVSYNDETYVIELSVDELNNYTFENLENYLSNNSSNINTYFTNTTINYNSLTWNYSASSNIIRYTNSFAEGYRITFNETNPLTINKFAYVRSANDEDTYQEFAYSIEWNLNATVYNDVKNAIELDIQANNVVPYTYFDFLTDSIGLLVGAIVPTASGIGGGLSTLVNALAISNNAMSPFAAVIFIFGGIGLALGLSRWVVNLISSLGQRNR